MTFSYRLVHSGFNETVYAYCDRCGLVLLLSTRDERAARQRARADWAQAVDAPIEPRLPPCACGGRFSGSASPRCPTCTQPLDPERAAAWLEANAEANAGGKCAWRWQMSWSGLYAMVIEGRCREEPGRREGTGQDRTRLGRQGVSGAGKRERRWIVAGLVALAAVLVLLAWGQGLIGREVWSRENPLRGPALVSEVRDGAVILADGRGLRPAGIRRRDGVSTGDYDRALRVMVAQGVVVTRDLGDGTAFMTVEPKFYNWCGTGEQRGIVLTRWAGTFIQCPLSELMIWCGYAAYDAERSGGGPTAREAWRLEGVERTRAAGEPPRIVSDELNALRFEGNETHFADEGLLGETWQRPPR